MLRTFKSCLTIGALALVPCAMPAVADDYGLPSLGSGASSVSGNEEHRLGRAWLRQFRAQTDTWQDPIAQTYV
ncbi:M48 family peptidase, partial [Halomonas sp. BBD48]|nr:M48 family peptidase [Halomonas sp. BBD48]